MIEKQVFNLEKIKEITGSIEGLQGKIIALDEVNKKISKYQEEITLNPFSKEFFSQFQEFNEIIKVIDELLIKISNKNVNKFLVFQDNLIEKYKDSFKDNLRDLNLDNEFMKKIGLFLIKGKQISKIIDKSSFSSSVSLDIWLDLVESLKSNTLFSTTIKKIRIFFDSLTQEKLEVELKKIPGDTSPAIIEDFRRVFKDNSITFNEYIDAYEMKLTSEQLEEKRILIEESKEKKEIKLLQKKQKRQQQSYQDYFKMSDEEFKRRRRKEKRKSLTDTLNEPSKLTEISEEVTEKIEKFKIEMDRRFKEEFIVKKDEDTDPLDLIRERMKKKTEEYKKFIKKFENEE